jgi:hypothetical protein
MSEPLAGHKDRCFDVELEHHHFKGRTVFVTQQVANEAPVLAHALGAASIGNARRLHDALVAAHVVYQSHEAAARYN